MITFNIIALFIYLAGGAYLFFTIKQNKTPNSYSILIIAAIAVFFHAIGVYKLVVMTTGIDLSIHKMVSMVTLAINLVVLATSLRQPLHSLFLFLFPITILSIIFSLMLAPAKFMLESISMVLSVHILLSLLAYSLIAIATLQALLWHWQNQQLKKRPLKKSVILLPPLQTMETLIFSTLWAGQILLTLGILVGFAYIDNIFAQQLVHKTVLSIFAWLVFAALLCGRHVLGWRGNIATKWVLSGFSLLMLGYFGSKLVLEILLNN